MSVGPISQAQLKCLNDRSLYKFYEKHKAFLVAWIKAHIYGYFRSTNPTHNTLTDNQLLDLAKEALPSYDPLMAKLGTKWTVTAAEASDLVAYLAQHTLNENYDEF